MVYDILKEKKNNLLLDRNPKTIERKTEVIYHSLGKDNFFVYPHTLLI